jgi:hypothetical protein
MITKDELLASMRSEIRIMKHLATKVPPGTWDWRPTPGQRSTLDLLRYVTHCGTIGAVHAVTDAWDHAEATAAASEAVTPETFAAAMDRQMADLEALVAPLTDADLRRATTMPWGAPTTVGLGLIEMGLKPLVAYRMQLFLHAKQSGNAALDSANCWIGVDRPRE